MSYTFSKKYATGLTAAMLLITQLVSAQQNSVKGKVVDDYGHELQNAQIRIKGTNTSTVTDRDGVYTLGARAGNTLLISYPGFDTTEVKVKNNSEIGTIRLVDSYLKHPQKVDVLYGQKDRDKILGSVSSTYYNEINSTPASSYLYSMPGRLNGLYTQQTQGFSSPQIGATTEVDNYVGNRPKAGAAGAGPSDNSEFMLRLRGQNPVTVVDGVQRDLYSLDPESIESISVLKDAMSTIMLGQRSSRGVVLVTTKKAETGAPHLSFTAETAIQQSLSLPKPMDAYRYAYLFNEALQNDGKPVAYSPDDLAAYKNHSDPYMHPDVNWYDQIVKKSSPMNRFNLNVSGGKGNARYIIGMNYMNQQGMYNTTDDNSNLQLRRYMINSNLDIDVTKNFAVQVQVFGRVQEGSQPGATSSVILSDLLSTPNNAYPVYNPNGSLGGNIAFPNNLLARVQQSGYIQSNNRDVMANLDLKYKFDNWVPGLWAKLKGNIAVQSANALDRSKFTPSYAMTITPSGDTSYSQNSNLVAQVNNFITVSNARYWYAQFTAGWDKKIGNHNIGIMALADERRTIFNYDLPGTATNFAGKVSYDFKEKFLAEGAINYSGFDRYAPGHKYGLFYAGSVGYNLAKENFIKDNASWINQLKFRATYGKTGNGVDNSGYYTWRQTYSRVFSIYGIGTSHAIGYGNYENGLANPDLTWEKGDKWDVGFDGSFFHDHFQITADYYHDKYSDLIQQRGKTIALLGVSLPPRDNDPNTVAYPNENIGVNLYQGAELTLTYQNHLGNFNYFVTANGALEKTKVIFTDEQKREYPWMVHTGLPVGQRFGLTADGFFQTAEEITKSATLEGFPVQPGDIKYKDLNNDGKIDQFDVGPIGIQKPLLYYGLTAGFNIKGFQVSALLQGVANRQMSIDNGITESAFQSLGKGYAQAYEQMQGRWIPENADDATYPRLSAGSNVNNQNPLYFGNSFWLRSGNYFRIKNLYVGYTLPYKTTSKIKLSAVTVFANAQNLYTWAAYDMLDPEVGYGSYPNQRVINFGINVKL